MSRNEKNLVGQGELREEVQQVRLLQLDSVNKESAIHGIQLTLWLQGFCQMFIPAITVGRHRFQDAGGGQWSSGEHTRSSGGRRVLVPTLFMRGV